MPDKESCPCSVTWTWSAYQPLARGFETSAVVTGGVESILIGDTVAVAVLPARSVTLAVALSAAPSPLTSVGSGQAATATPESESEQVQVTVTPDLFHPAPFDAGDADPVIVGGVLSTLIPGSVALEELPALS